MTPSRIRILVVDDHPIVRKGLESLIESEPDMELAASTGSGADAVRLFRETQPDVTLMDLTLTKEMSGLQAIQTIRGEFPVARIIVFSARQGDHDVYQAIQAGAATYLPKDTLSEELIPAIREVHEGQRRISPEIGQKLAEHVALAALTARELEVLQLVGEGLRNHEIGLRLHISELTVEGHMKKILPKLNARDRTSAVAVAIRRGIIHID